MDKCLPAEVCGPGRKIISSRLLHFAEAFGNVQVVLGDGNRGQQHDFLGRLGAVLQEGNERLHAKGALLAGELLDGGGEAAIDRRPRLGRGRMHCAGDDTGGEACVGTSSA